MPTKSDSKTSLSRQQSCQRCLGAICSPSYAQVINQSVTYVKLCIQYLRIYFESEIFQVKRIVIEFLLSRK